MQSHDVEIDEIILLADAASSIMQGKPAVTNAEEGILDAFDIIKRLKSVLGRLTSLMSSGESMFMDSTLRSSCLQAVNDLLKTAIGELGLCTGPGTTDVYNRRLGDISTALLRYSSFSINAYFITIGSKKDA